MNRLAWIALITVALAVALAVQLRMRKAPAEPVPVEIAYPRFDAEAELTAAGIVPYRIQVPKDHEVHLVVRGAPGAKEGLLTLLGYEDLTHPADLGPGVSREIVFTSTRPGDDFGFSLGGEVVGRLEVTGGHLEDGHR